MNETTAIQNAAFAPALPPDRGPYLIELFFDGNLVYQQQGREIFHLVPQASTYRPHRLAIALDGEIAFAIEGRDILVNRLSAPLIQYVLEP